MKKHTLLLILLISLAKLICAQNPKKESSVYILGTIHSNHLVADFEYTLKDLENIIDKIKPDLICIEMTPDALGSDYEGYFPPENSVVIEYAKRHNIKVSPVDWRYNLSETIKKQPMSAEDKKRINTARGKIDKLAITYMMQNNWKRYFDFIQGNSDFHKAIKEQHDTKIELLGEESDGYWITRNNKITENLMAAIKQNGAKTVLVTIGLHHKYILEELLAAKPTIKVEQIPTQQASENRELSKEVIQRWEKNLANLNKLISGDSVTEPFKAKIKQSRRLKELNGFINTKGVADKKIRHMFEKKS
jgi:pheromone shutdown protein TraB